MTRPEFDFLCRFLKERSGLVLAADKEYLVENRLTPVARRAGLATVGELIQRLREASAVGLDVEVIEAMMNNESFFFRDKIPFELFSSIVLPDLIERRARSRSMRIWCCAASTGQEPYSLAMLLDDAQLDDWQVGIVATDISNEALEKARIGLYSQFEVQRGLPIQMLMRHFERDGTQWRISDRLKRKVRFAHLNLLSDFSFLGTFDVVFCRNVLIYFDQATKVAVLDRVRRMLPADGYLVLGAAETVVGLGNAFSPVPDKRGLYRPGEKVSAVPPALGGERVA